MRTRVCTLMWGSAWERYGREFVETFERHWPESVELFVITDRPIESRRAIQFPLADVPGYSDFMDRWRDDPRACGMQSQDRKAVKEQRFWKHDAVKWAPQAMAPFSGLAGMGDGDILAWLDADVISTRDVPPQWLDELLDGNELACILRGAQHPEIGFWAIRVGPSTCAFVRDTAACYRYGGVFDLPEWHSGYVFGAVLRRYQEIKTRNLNPTMMRRHPWPITELAKYTEHKKGKLKGQ